MCVISLATEIILVTHMTIFCHDQLLFSLVNSFYNCTIYCSYFIQNIFLSHNLNTIKVESTKVQPRLVIRVRGCSRRQPWARDSISIIAHSSAFPSLVNTSATYSVYLIYKIIKLKSFAELNRSHNLFFSIYTTITYRVRSILIIRCTIYYREGADLRVNLFEQSTKQSSPHY